MNCLKLAHIAGHMEFLAHEWFLLSIFSIIKSWFFSVQILLEDAMNGRIDDETNVSNQSQMTTSKVELNIELVRRWLSYRLNALSFSSSTLFNVVAMTLHHYCVQRLIWITRAMWVYVSYCFTIYFRNGNERIANFCVHRSRHFGFGQLPMHFFYSVWIRWFYSICHYRRRNWNIFWCYMWQYSLSNI